MRRIGRAAYSAYGVISIVIAGLLLVAFAGALVWASYRQEPRTGTIIVVIGVVVIGAIAWFAHHRPG